MFSHRIRHGLLAPALLVLLAMGTARPVAQSSAPASPPRTDTPRAPGGPSDPAIERRLLDAVARSPDSFDAHRALAELYLRQDQLAMALPHLERAQALDPSHTANSSDLARAWMHAGKPEPARELVMRLLGAKETAELLNLLGNIAESEGNFIAAAEPYQRAARMAPTEEHLFDWGNNLVRLRAFDEAIQVFTPSIVRHPASARLHVGLGIAQYSLGRYDAAVKSFCQAADLDPDDPRPYRFLGEMYGVAPDQSSEVTRRLARFVAARPDDALGQFYYALNLWRGQGVGGGVDVKQVETHLRRAVALDPSFAKGFLELGILLSEQRRYPEAIVELRRAVSLQSDLAQAHYRLAQAYQRTGRKEEAATSLATFEQLKERESPPPAVPDPGGRRP